MVKELSNKEVVFDAKPKHLQVEPRVMDLDHPPVRGLSEKQTLAVASMVMYVWKSRPRIFRMICIAIGVDYQDIYEWAREVLRCT